MAEFIFSLKSRNNEARKIKPYHGLDKEAMANFRVTAPIKPNEAALTPSKAPATSLDDLNVGIRGRISHTKRNEGKNIPMVDTKAPGTPRIKYPTKVAVVNTGPGVSCPMATASIS